MSCFLVNKGSIDVIVNAYSEFVMGQMQIADRMDRMGRELWRENVRSVNFRYGERGRTPVYRAEWVTDALDPVTVLAVISCYEYQSCERPDWSRSHAKRLIDEITDRIRRAHPDLFVTYRRGDWDREAWRLIVESDRDAHPRDPRSVRRALKVQPVRNAVGRPTFA